MNIISKMKLFVGGFMIVAASTASASLITANGNATNALQLTESFEDFYNFDDPNTFSANTGLEQANSVVAFLAESANELALFLIFSGPGGDAGSADFDITGTDGAISFVDDAQETPTASNVIFNYVAGKTDGLIFSGLTDASWSVDVIFNATTGLDSLTFLTFDDQGESSVLFATSGVPEALNVQTVAVSAPLTGALLLTGLGCLLYRRK